MSHAKPGGDAAVSVLHAAGSNACSFAMRSIHDTKETILLVCIGFLDALDNLQTKLRLPTALVKDLKRKLSRMINRSLLRPIPVSTLTKIQQAEHLGSLIAESDTWTDVAKPEEVKGFVDWLLALMKWLNDLALATTFGTCRRIFILIMNFPGVPTACTLFCRLFDVIERVIHFALGSSSTTTAVTQAPRKSRRHKYEKYMDDSSLTAVVLEYREKECMVPVNINRRIQQFMHFEIPLRSFEATVRLPSPELDEEMDAYTSKHSTEKYIEQDMIMSSTASSSASSAMASRDPSSASPRSVPASPRERRKFELIYENYFDDVLYQARDKLRLQRAVNLTGEKNRQIPKFNKFECDEELHLTCGRNCAIKDGPGMYRSVRGTVPILRNRYVYFEMELAGRPSPTAANGTAKGSTALVHRPTLLEEISACIGVAPRSLPLNALVGTARSSVGFYSAGYVLVGGQQRQFYSASPGFACPATVGVLVFIEDDDGSAHSHKSADVQTRVARAEVQFSVNGQAVRDEEGKIVVSSFYFPARFELYPTLSLHTQGLRVYAQFSSPDIGTFDPSCFVLAHDEAEEVVCLDGLKVPLPRRAGHVESPPS